MKILEASKIISTIAQESIWPTRCIVCDKPNTLLCSKCVSKINFIDSLKTCKYCGEPYGLEQCCNCNYENKNKRYHKIKYYDMCKSVVILDSITGKIVTGYKDAGERRLSKVIAYMLSKQLNLVSVPKEYNLITYIPSTKEAFMKRGFDHAQIIANQLSHIINLPSKCLFNLPKTIDMRKLNRQERSKNIQSSISVLKDKYNIKEMKILLIDDVFTTGSTLNQASLCLKDAGVKKVDCLTFARTY